MVVECVDGPGEVVSACALSGSRLGHCVGAWRSLVARTIWGREVPGSNPGAPIILQSLVKLACYG